MGAAATAPPWSPGAGHERSISFIPETLKTFLVIFVVPASHAPNFSGEGDFREALAPMKDSLLFSGRFQQRKQIC
jgi:hypothetical protein